MNTKVTVRRCGEYNPIKVYDLISEIYTACEGPDVSGKKVLVKPNILIDSNPAKCISTHPVVVEAMVRLLQSKGATVLVGDSPAMHLPGFKCEKSGIYDVCRRTGAEWVDFLKNPAEAVLKNGKIRIASVTREVDLIISLPKFKNHELVYFTGAIKNSLGLVPGFSKAMQHALHNDRDRFSVFLVDLNEAVTPHFFIMDGIMGMEGHGPGQGTPFATEVLIGSSNPLAMDIIASTIAGYDPMDIPTNAIALSRRQWLTDRSDIVYDGPELETLIRKDFKRIPISVNENIVARFIKHRLHFIKRFEKRPVFKHINCTGCQECIKICPVNAITMHPEKKKWVVLTDNKCIRCFCCAEVCQYSAVEVRRKVFGD
ncbi:MAG: DUF362 domain-containing protein [Bacteroidia bacterium]|nr:DUF362 domain-containing protein [Bacteroidia bacterium]